MQTSNQYRKQISHENKKMIKSNFKKAMFKAS